MRTKSILLTAALLSAAFVWGQGVTPEREHGGGFIFETDMGNDVDDALAIDMLYKYADLGTINLLAVMTNKDNRYSAEYIDILNTWYGHPELPVGIVRNGADSGGDDNYAAKVCMMKDKRHRAVFKRPVKDLAQKVFHEWPTPIVTSPWEVGNAIEYPATSIENDFSWLKTNVSKHKEDSRHSPVVEAYKAYMPMPYDRPTWDLTSVLYAVEGPDWFGLSPYGTIHVDDNGKTTFEQKDNGNCRYLITTPAQNHRILQHFINLVTRQP